MFQAQIARNIMKFHSFQNKEW